MSERSCRENELMAVGEGRLVSSWTDFRVGLFFDWVRGFTCHVPRSLEASLPPKEGHSQGAKAHIHKWVIHYLCVRSVPFSVFRFISLS